jgi:hypothetical protein
MCNSCCDVDGGASIRYRLEGLHVQIYGIEVSIQGLQEIRGGGKYEKCGESGGFAGGRWDVGGGVVTSREQNVRQMSFSSKAYFTQQNQIIFEQFI